MQSSSPRRSIRRFERTFALKNDSKTKHSWRALYISALENMRANTRVFDPNQVAGSNSQLYATLPLHHTFGWLFFSLLPRAILHNPDARPRAESAESASRSSRRRSRVNMASARHHLTIAEKNQLRACHRAHPDLTQELLRDWAHTKFGKWIGRSTIGKIAGSPDELCVNQDAKRNQSGRFPDMERVLFDFVLSAAKTTEETTAGNGGNGGGGAGSSTPAVLSDAALWTKANEILKETVGEHASVSVGWVQRFKKRHGLHKGQKRPLQHPGSGGEAPSVQGVQSADGLSVAVTSSEAPRPSVSASSGEDADQQRVDGATSTPSELQPTPTGRSTVRKQFVAADDILLLSQALALKPWAFPEAMNGWRQVAEALRSHKHFGLDKSAGACQARVSLLLEHSRAGNESALRKSGSADEFLRKKELLAEIAAELDQFGGAIGSNRKRPASEMASSTLATTESMNTRRRTATASGSDDAGVGEDAVTRRLELLEVRLETELAAQRQAAEQRVGALETRCQQQVDEHQHAVNQRLATIEQQQTTIIEMLRLIIGRTIPPEQPEAAGAGT